MVDNNWVYEGNEITDIEQFPEGAIGFIYRIDNLTNGMYYYGRKTCRSSLKKRLTKKDKKLKENARRKFKYVEVEYKDWKGYTGSNKKLNEHIVKEMHEYKKTILRFCSSKSQMTFYETKEIVCSDCMLDDLCYNDWFSARVTKINLNK